MKLKELKDRIDSQIRIMMQAEEAEVVVQVHSTGSIGFTPAVSIESAHLGFDWDSGRYILHPAQNIANVELVQRVIAENTFLQSALQRIRDRANNPGKATGEDAVFCFMEAERALHGLKELEDEKCAEGNPGKSPTT